MIINSVLIGGTWKVNIIVGSYKTQAKSTSYKQALIIAHAGLLNRMAFDKNKKFKTKKNKNGKSKQNNSHD